MLLDLHQLVYGGDVVVAPAPQFTSYTFARIGGPIVQSQSPDGSGPQLTAVVIGSGTKVKVEG